MNIIRGYTEIQKGINSFHKSVAHVDETVHQLACSALTHAAEHGDSTLCTMLVQAMPKSARRAALIEWNTKFGALTWVKIGEEQKFKKSAKRSYDLETAYATPFYDLTEDRVPKPFDLAMLIKMVEKAVSKAEKGKADGSLTVNNEGYVLLSETVSKLIQTVKPESIMQVAMEKAEQKAA